MNTTPPELRDLARQLLAAEESHDELPPFAAAILVCQKLREPLVKLAGAEGFRALLLRALSLATKLQPELAALQVGSDGSLVRVAPPSAPDDRAGRAEAELQLVVQLLSLLATFIGHSLTLQFVHGKWPNLAENMPRGTFS